MTFIRHKNTELETETYRLRLRMTHPNPAKEIQQIVSTVRSNTEPDKSSPLTQQSIQNSDPAAI